MKINLVDQLQKTDKDNVDIVQAAQKLLDSHDQEKRHTLRKLGMSTEIDHHDETMSKHLIKKHFREKYGEGIIHIDEIKQACIKYKLRFLDSNKYVGKIDNQLADVVIRYCNKWKISPDPSYFKVLAPPEIFALVKVKEETALQNFVRILKDPIMFHYLGDDCYRIVHKWGNDFTFLRRIKAYPFQSKVTMFLSITPLLFALLFMIISLFTHIYTAGVLGLMTLSVSLGSLYSYFGRHDEEINNKMFYSIHNWDTDKKI